MKYTVLKRRNYIVEINFIAKLLWITSIRHVMCMQLQCSTKCGLGSQHRHVFCGSMVEDVITKLAPSECSASEKPLAEQECTGHHCAGEWFVAPFGKVG